MHYTCIVMGKFSVMLMIDIDAKNENVSHDIIEAFSRARTEDDEAYIVPGTLRLLQIQSELDKQRVENKKLKGIKILGRKWIAKKLVVGQN